MYGRGKKQSKPKTQKQSAEKIIKHIRNLLILKKDKKKKKRKEIKDNS